MAIQRKRIVVTGMGVLTSIAANLPDFKEALFAKQCGIKPSEKYLAYFENANASEILRELRYEGLSEELVNTLDKAALWAYKVGYDALLHGNITQDRRADMGLLMAVSSPGTEAYLPIFEKKFASFSLKKSMLCGSFASSGAVVSSLLGIKGGFDLVSTACTASVNAIGMAFDQIQNQKNPMILVVGTEPLYMPTFAGFYGLHAMKTTPSSPFSGSPGMSIGEGAGSLLLEEYEHAMARGATIYGEIVSYATSSDAHHETAPDPRAEGAVQVMRHALRNANVTTEDIQYINAHGTGTDANDRSETLAMKKVFPNAADIPISSTKAYVGHNIGSAGIIELIACFLTLPENKVLPTLNFTTPRQNCDLNYVPNEFIDAEVTLFMKNNYAFGGNNCSVIASVKPEATPVTHYDPKRIAITGMGAVSSLGHDIPSILQSIRAGSKGGELFKLLPDEQAKQDLLDMIDHMSVNREVMESTAEMDIEGMMDKSTWKHVVSNLDPRKHLRRFDPRKADTVSTYALMALTQAMKEANRKIKRDGHDLGMILGMSKGTQATVERYVQSLYPDPTKVRTSEFPGSLINSVATFCAISEGIKGYNTTLACGVNAAFGALSYGYEIIRQNLQPQVIVGGADEQFQKFIAQLQVMSSDMQLAEDPSAFQVYSEKGNGFLDGEGAGMLFLEDYQHAKERGVRVLAEVLGYGKSCDAAYFGLGISESNDTAEVRSRSMVSAIRQALDEAQINIEQIDLICGGSVGTEKENRLEIEAIRGIWREKSRDIPLVNYCAHFGVVESCIGILNMVMVIDAMQSGEILPIPYTQDFCADDMMFVTKPLKREVNIALVLGSTDGGNHYAFLLKKDQE